MNNGKVRIYDLARDLNLDNKVVLGICDQKGIAYKSHSSTISESEAEMIRVAAEHLPPSARLEHSARPSHSPRVIPAPTPKPQRTQQILEIRSHRPVPTENGPAITPTREVALEPAAVNGTISRPQRPVQRPAPAASSPAAPPSGSASPTTSAPAFVAEAFDAEASTQVLTAPIAKEQVAKEKDAANQVVAQPPASPPIRPTRPASQSPNAPATAVAAPASVAPARLTVLKPPAMPTAPTPPAASATTSSATSASTTTPARTERPAGLGRPAPAEVVTPPQRPQIRPSRPVPPAPAGEPTVTTIAGTGPIRVVPASRPDAAPTPTLQAPPRLQAPPTRLIEKPIPAGSAPAKAKTGAEGEDTIEVLQDLSLTKLGSRVKRGKTKAQEEEELLQEELLKAGNKAAAKLKRRPLMPVEDDDDMEFGGDANNQQVVDVSLSLVRPPKPKSAKQATKPAAVTSSRPAAKSSRKPSRFRGRRTSEEVQEKPEIISLTGDLTVQELAAKLVVEASEVIKVLFFKGIAATINQMLDQETATMVAEAMDVEVLAEEEASAARKVTEMIEADDMGSLVRRPPVVTIMGHVDHGKTTLLDSIRKTKVAQGEAGGITQHIGAYHVDVDHAGQTQQVVFLDTPGHEAFTAMRARGARVTDVAILVVAADDGVRPQTIEAISHAKAAEVPIVVAINKVDKPSAQPDRVKQELTEHGLVSEEWGGDTIMVPVSAITGDNLDTLLEMILLVSEVEDLYANPDRTAKGTVIEAHLDKARGAVATLLVQNGTLRVGDILVAGSAMGKVRAMVDDRGQRVSVASPSFAVEVLGLGDVPAAGEEFEVFTDEKEARAVSSSRASEQRQSRLQQALSSRRVSLTGLSDQAREGELKELNLILKSDVQGSLEAIVNALGQLPQNEVQLRVLLSAPGEITETDVDLAAASNAVIIGFNTTLATGARQSADQSGVDIREYNIIYKLLDDIQGAMEGLLEPEMVEEELGQAQVRAVFPVGKGSVAGCYVQNGKIVRNCKVRIHRGNTLVHTGILNSLKRMKEDAREVNSGYECGVRLDDFHTWQEGDIIEAYLMVTKRRSLSPA